MDVFPFLPAIAAAILFLSTRFLLPMKAVRLALGSLLSADASTLAPATNANKIALIIAPFSPTEDLVIGDLTLATAGGLAAVAGATGAQTVGIDPVTLEQRIQIKPPAGGYKWISSGGGPYPIAVYGYALIDNAAATLLGVQTFNPPINVSDDGQLIEADPVNITFVAQPMQ